MQNKNLKNSFNHLVTDYSKQLQVIEVKNSIISELEQKCKYFKKQVNDLSLRLKSLDLYKSQVEILTNEKNRLENENTYLKNQWNERYGTQQKRITEISKIALLERKLLYNDIIYLINDCSQFSLENLLAYNPLNWLKYHNPVIVKFIEVLTDNDDEQLYQKKVFKRIVAVDAIYKSQHSKYVSEINLAASAIKYTIARSKLIIDIDSHITGGGGYTKFINWIESLAIEPKLLPDRFLILAFDNEQKGQKNYLDRGHNTVVFHTVTSFVAFDFDSNNDSQLKINPWKTDLLSEDNINQLFYLSNDMKDILEIELHNFINEIISNLYSEKNQEANEIDKLVEKQNTLSFQQTVLSENINKTIVFRPYEPKKPSVELQKSKISITQKTIINQGIKIPDLYVPDPIPINPNSLINVQKILEHIEIITGIKSGKHKWIPVVCDSVPYNQALKLKKFSLVNFTSREIDIKIFARCQGYQTDNQLDFFRKCIDHHKVWDSICNIYRYSMASELIWPRHPIYKLLEVSYEETLLNLKPQIRETIENISVISRSGLHNQHQGLDAIMEEINKALKSLISPVPSQHYWEIAARNYINFLKNNEPDLILCIEEQRFRVYLRKKQFLNPIKLNSAFTNLDGGVNLSEKMKSFSILAQEKRQTFIKNTLMQKTSTGTWQAIPVTEQEAEMLKNEKMMKKEELISVINSILILLPESQRSKYTNLKNKTKTMLLTILQEIRDLNNLDEAVGEDDVNKEAIDEDNVNKEPADEEVV
ncbi:hypothetical protein F8M41_023403 [Gigaspora margarita]|uniref:Uncharacterized protein n=1 Tax=Gigaspora margarita TaxID=4874 RepID=A0A8H4B0X8_GIGMA|nr:hypothetical protein F8M41_023403 [Gigaspora margarita]